MPITGNGWELHIRRLSIHRSGAKVRSYGQYQVFLDGGDVDGLSGYVCESVGPGDNTVGENGKRIEAGSYPLWTQFGEKYKSVGYSTDLVTPGALRMPGIRVGSTGNRTHILIHPGHPPTLYLSSIGCFNLTSALEPTDDMEYWDSREKVIDLLQSLKAFAPAAFVRTVNTEIVDAWLVVEGEPS